MIPAHKFVVSIGSPAFEATFYGDIPETWPSIELRYLASTVNTRVRWSFFSTCIAMKVNLLNGRNVMEVLCLAKKYIVPSLVNKCSQYLRDVLSSFNVFDILPTAEKLEKKELIDECWELIDNQSEAAEGSRDPLSINEIELFKAVNLRATKKCEDQREGLKANSELKRNILGETFVKANRFPIMKEQNLLS